MLKIEKEGCLKFKTKKQMTNNIMAFMFALYVLGVSTAFSPINHKIPLTSTSAEWKLAKDNNSVKVFTRQSEGSKIKEFKAIITVTSARQYDTPPPTIMFL